MARPARHWVAAAVDVRTDTAKFAIQGASITGIHVLHADRTIEIRVTNPATRTATVTVTVRPDFDGADPRQKPRTGQQVRLGPRDTKTLTFRSPHPDSIQSVQLDSDQPIIPGGDVQTFRTWNPSTTATLWEVTPLVWYEVSDGPPAIPGESTTGTGTGADATAQPRASRLNPNGDR
ncbi:hypothetical protein [Orlajensenia leifsoniae]|uniref:Uncharacterized protein n=1 Tax=Orlajensenia leifsoniae TaxID=2561933 RepID=A0A4Y9R2P5_9MICO|nr:hypothetical protein [Leifsonia flava]TFV98924.1 hypothetical protein E4M00_05325 [Leifsonia flava]